MAEETELVTRQLGDIYYLRSQRFDQWLKNAGLCLRPAVYLEVMEAIPNATIAAEDFLGLLTWDMKQ